MSALKKILNFIFNYSQKVFSFSLAKRYAIKIRAWLLTPVPRYRTIIATVAFVAIMTTSLLYNGAKIFAATYTFTQTSWSGGATANNATHTSNQTGWTEYSAKDDNFTTVNGGADLQLATQSNTWTVTDDGTTDTGFNNTGAVKSQTTVTGTGSGASVVLDGSNDPTSWSKYSSNPVLDLGANGTFDDVHASIPNIIKDGSTYKMWYAGYDGATWKIGYATSSDGISWTKSGSNPVLSPGVDGTWDDGYIEGGSVIKDGSTYKMWYTGHDGTTYKIGYATSSDGISWTKSGSNPVLSVGSFDAWDDFYVSSPSVIKDGSTYKMWYTGFDGTTYKIGYATSSDGISWTKSGSNPVLSVGTGGSWDSSRVQSPYVIFNGLTYEMWFVGYNGTNLKIGYATSSDGISWTKSGSNPVLSVGTGGSWDSSHVANTSVVKDSLTYKMWFTGNNGVNQKTGYAFNLYGSPGTFTSHIYDTTANTSLGTLSFTTTTPAGTSITIKARSANNSDMSDATAWGSCSNITSGAALSTGGCVINGQRYIQWQGTLTTTDTTQTPTLSDVTINYTNYPSSQTLTSSAYNSTDSANVIGSLAWTEDTSLPTGTTVTTSLRTASTSGGLTSADWSDFTNATTNCAKTTGTVTCSSSAIPAGLKDGTGDQWFQYKVTLTSTGGSTPTFSDITVQYVVNAPPEFNPASGLTVAQVTDSADANWGKIRIDYSVRDTDTTSGTTDPGFVTPSFQYNIGAGWVAIDSGSLSANATLHQAVDVSSYTTYTAYWDAQTDIPANYLTTAQIKVTVNDLEAANNTASSTSSNFTLDTKVPTGSLNVDASGNTLTLTSSDDTNLQYILSNNSDLTADGVNATSGVWTSVGSNSVSVNPAWTVNFVAYYPTVYGSVRDTAGNTTAFTVVGPIVPTNMFIQDISNVPAATYKEFISWEPYVAAGGAVFSKYEVYRSTDGVTYGAAVSNISDAAVNYYVDQTVANGVHYYYKIRTVDSDTDKSTYSSVVDDITDGQGGSDTTAPSITSVTVTEQQATYATVTWTTDELANSEIDYSISPSTAFDTQFPVSSYVTSHSVTVTGLAPNTTYLFRVKSTDISGNVATNDNSGAGFTITTIGGPIISNVTETEVNEHSATIAWNTNTDSDSFVSYSTSSSLASPTRSGSATLVGGPPYQHKVSLSGLASGTKYYYFVESTDASSNNSKDTNGDAYYSFTTTSDTKAPVISAVSVPVSALTAAVVVWNTDEVATSIVDYGTTSGSYSSSTTLDSTLTIFHIGSLSSLTENTKYYYQVRSSDNAGNEATSSEYNFTTDQTHTVTVGGGSGGGGSSSVVLDTSPPIISNIAAKDIKAFSATVDFNTNEESVGFVLYGTDPANLNMTSGDSSYSQKHQIKLSGLTMGKKYSFAVKVVDKSGNIASSATNTFTTAFFTESLIQIKDTEAFQKEIEDAIESALPSLVPPFIEKPEVINITDSGASVTWKTNVKSYGSVAYADEAAYDEKKDNPYVTEIANTLGKVVEHKIDLPNLQPDTRYHIMVRSFSLPEVVGKSKDLTFLTEALKIQANIVDVTNNSFKAVWTTSEPTTSVVEYRNLKTGELNQKSSDEKTKAHEVLADNLTPGTSYSVNIFGYNEKGNKISITSSVVIKTSIDTTAPKITSLMIDSALIPGRNDRAQTIVSWKTDEPSTSAVFFKEGSSSPDEKLTNKVEITDNFVIDHAVVVSSLKPGGLYSIQVSSTDAAGNTALFPIRTALVPEQSQSVVEIIFKNFEDTFRFLRR